MLQIGTPLENSESFKRDERGYESALSFVAITSQRALARAVAGYVLCMASAV